MSIFSQKIYKLSKTNIFFSHFEGTRGEKNQIFRTKVLRMLGYNAMQVIELIGNVASFRGFWNVLDAFFMPG